MAKRGRLYELVRSGELLEKLGLMLAVVSILAAATSFGLFKRIPGSSATEAVSAEVVLAELEAQGAQIESAQVTLESIDGRVEALESLIATIPEVPEQSAIVLEMDHLSDDISSLHASMSNLEEIILDDPLKAVAVPLLRNDLDSLDARLEADILGMRQEVARVYNLATWVVGLMFTLAVGIFVLALTPFFKRKGESE